MNSADLAKIDTILTINSDGLPLYFFNIPGFPDDSQNIKFLEFGKTYLFSSNSVGYNLCTDSSEVTTTEPPLPTLEYIGAINTRANVLGSPKYGYSVSISYNGGTFVGISAPRGTDPLTGESKPYYYVAFSELDSPYVDALNDSPFIYGNPQANGIIHLHKSFVFTSKDYYKTEIRHMRAPQTNPTLVNGIVKSSTESANIVYFVANYVNNINVYSLFVNSQGGNTVTPYGLTITPSSLSFPATGVGYNFVFGTANGYDWKISIVDGVPVLYGTVTYSEADGSNVSRRVIGIFAFNLTSGAITTILAKPESDSSFSWLFDVTTNFYATIESDTTWDNLNSSTSRSLIIKNSSTGTEDKFDFPLLGDVDLDTGWAPIDMKFRGSYIFLLDRSTTPNVFDQRIRVYHYGSSNLTHRQTIQIPFTWPASLQWEVASNGHYMVISDQYYNNNQGRVIFYKLRIGDQIF